MVSDKDQDIPLLAEVYKMPEIARYLSIEDNFFHYVTNTENVYFYKVYLYDDLVAAIQLEKQGRTLYMAILVFPEYQRRGVATRILKDVKDGFGLDKIEVSVNSGNLPSLRLFEKAGFCAVSQEEELINLVYKKAVSDC